MFPGRAATVDPAKAPRPWWKTWRLALVPPALVVIALIGIGLTQRELAKTPGATATAVQSIATVTLPANESGTIASANEVDVYRFVVRANQDVQVELRLVSLADGGITLFDASNTQLANENAVGNNKVVTISYHIKDAGSYHVAVRGLRNSTGTYQLVVTAR